VYRLKQHDVWASEIAQYLNSDLQGEDFILAGPSSITTSLVLNLRKASCSYPDKLLVISDSASAAKTGMSHIFTDNPAAALAQVLLEFFAGLPVHTIHPSAVVSESAVIGRDVMIGAHTVIGENVEIDDSTVIFNNVVINGPASIGQDCVIKDGAVIGSEGYVFVKNNRGQPTHAPHFGRILIGNRVWVGSNSTIERAMIEDTVIEDDVKIDDLVHVGHGTVVGEKSMLTAGVVISHDITIGANVTVAPNAAVREYLSIVDNVLIGQGAVVVKNIDRPGTYVGNPARFLKDTD